MGIKILIVDDDKTSRLVTRLALEPAGYQFWEADNGEEALRLAAQIQPDLILMDVNMPVMDGLEACRRIKADPGLASIFVIIVSGSRIDAESQIIGLDIGADDYLTQPISNRELLARVKAMLRIRAYETALRAKEAELRDLIASNDALRLFQTDLIETMGEGISVTDTEGTITFFNLAGAAMLGYTPQDLVGKRQAEILPAEEVDRVQAIDRQRALGVASRYELNLCCKDGSLLPVQVSGSPHYRDGKFIGTLAVFSDISQLKRSQKLLEVRLALMEFASSHTITEILQKTLDEVGKLVQSPIGFYHFVEPDQQTLSLQTWSTRTLQEYCTAEGVGRHYPIDQAGVWVDCIQQRKPVIHNDYAALPNRKGLPTGHAPLIRELVVPIFRRGLVVAILGVGNKASKYDVEDVETVTYFADVTWEIVELQRTQQALQASERQYRQLFDQSITGFALHEIICDERGQPVDYRFLSANVAFEAMTGLKSAEIAGRRVLDILPGTEPDWIERYGRVALTGQPEEFEAFSQEMNKYFEVRAYSPEKGQFATLFLDITERKRVQQQLASYTENLEEVVAERTHELRAAQEKILRQERLSLLGQLAGSVGHELRTPLGVISNAIYLLKLIQPDANEKVKEYHTLIKEEINKADRIIGDLLDFARLKSISKEAVQVPVLVGRVLERFPVGGQVQVTLELPEGLPPVHADPRQIEQVLGNLVVNACQAMPSGGKLSISAVQQAGEMAIAVQDSGQGIAPENLPRLFEPLFTTKPKGIGLGLSICKKLIEANDGRIELQSEVGKGTIFTIFLPAYQGYASIGVGSRGAA